MLSLPVNFAAKAKKIFRSDLHACIFLDILKNICGNFCPKIDLERF